MKSYQKLQKVIQSYQKVTKSYLKLSWVSNLLIQLNITFAKVLT